MYKRIAGRSGTVALGGIRVDWTLGEFKCQVGFYVDDDATFCIALPFLFSLYVSQHWARWAHRLPGVRSGGGRWSLQPGAREVHITFHNGCLFWRFWTNPDYGESHYWRAGSINFGELFFGRSSCTELPRETIKTRIMLPEGGYDCQVELYAREWTWRRWPTSRTVYYYQVEIPGGIPFPGKGYDDAYYSVAGSCDTPCTVFGALTALQESVEEKRAGWVPEKAPSHCINSLSLSA